MSKYSHEFKSEESKYYLEKIGFVENVKFIGYSSNYRIHSLLVN